MANKSITIDGNVYRARWSMMAIITWEEAQGKPFEIKTNRDLLLFLYCIFITSNDESIPNIGELVPFRRFCDWLDEDEQNEMAFKEIIDEKAKKKTILTMSGHR